MRRSLRHRYGHARSMRYTVVTNQSRLGRWVSKREAVKVAKLWASHGTYVATVLDEMGHTALALKPTGDGGFEVAQGIFAFEPAILRMAKGA